MIEWIELDRETRVAVAHNHIKQPSPVPENGVVHSVLVVDDSRAQRRILSSYLSRWGYLVHEAGSGDEALKICATENIDLVVSDWMMPGMTGLEFCEAFRNLDRTHYGYFILLTSKSDKAEVARGLDVGADDFLTKPVAGDELLARIRAGERILRVERELTEKNRLISTTLQEISDLYDSVDRDLVEARKLQQSLVRERFRDFGTAQLSLILHPCGHVGGDLVGFFPIGDDSFGVFSLDVSGHGIASALMTARLAAYLTGSTPEQNIAIERGDDGVLVGMRPSLVAEKLNRLMLEEMETDLYFTMLLGHFNTASGVLDFVQCGHPHPLLQRADGGTDFLGAGGMPIGLFAEAQFEDIRVDLGAGDRVLFYSDGVTECPDPEGKMLGEDGLIDQFTAISGRSGKEFLDTFLWTLASYNKDQGFDDDVSAILLEFDGEKRV
ncbi:PP2C family protein-serine/threonine phosphatase [Celeribacter arenosi]|uniref:SpoIIE family protein phosphatase n=1 Tax=Celeribacter arenosi TaxID=792649 RepID=A0ABP7JXU2_9RHOB